MRKEYKLSDLKTVPNILSMLRILIIPVFVYLYMTAKTGEDYRLVAIIVLISGITDLLDGFIARRLNQITEIGKLLDPVADKLTQLAIIVCLVSRYDLMKYLLALFVVKEGLMALLGLYFMNRKDMKLDGAEWFGKLSTVVFYSGSIILFFFYELDIEIVTILVAIMGLFLLISLVFYARTYYTMNIEYKNKTTSN